MPTIDTAARADSPAAIVLDLLVGAGALAEGHFQLSSGLHSPRYVQCARLLESPWRAEACGRMLAEAVGDLPVDVVVGPALGGILIAHEVARVLDRRCLFTEREAAQMALRRGFAVRPGERALLVEDVVTTGKSVREAQRALERGGATAVGFACIVNRTDRNFLDGLPLRSLIRLELQSYAPADCPGCAAGEPLQKPGSRPG
jgi:orotate phosphoribosyltransferase